MLHEGLYSVFMEDWLRIFPEDQIFVSRMEDYSSGISSQMKVIYNFLELSKLSHVNTKKN